MTSYITFFSYLGQPPILFTGKSILEYGDIPALNKTRDAAISGALLFAAVPGIVEGVSVFAKEVVKEPINTLNESLIEKIGEHYLFQAPLGVAACATLGFSLGGMLAVGYFAAEGINKGIMERERLQVIEWERQVIERERRQVIERNNNSMVGISEPLVRKMLGMNLGDFDLPLNVLKHIAEYASHVELPQAYPVDMNKLDPYGNALRAAQGIKFIRQGVKEEEEERLAKQSTANIPQARTYYNLLEEGNLSISRPEDKIIYYSALKYIRIKS